MSRSFQLARRSFLKRSLALPLLRRLGAQNAPLVDAGFHLHPRYRAQTPLDATLLKTKAGLDEFVVEKYHDEIGAILAEWATNLLESPAQLRAIEQALAPSFLGSSQRPADSWIVRPGQALEVRRLTFSPQPSLGPDAFVRELRSSLGAFTKIETAEFQVTRIDQQNDGTLRTRVRYELTGAAPGFHREQRVGWWNLEWSGPGRLNIGCEAGRLPRRREARPESDGLKTLPRKCLSALLPTRNRCFAASIIGERCSMVRQASTSMATMAFRLLISTATVSTTSTSASPPVFLTGSIKIEATEHSRTLPRLPVLESSKILPALFLPTSIAVAGRTLLWYEPTVRYCS